MRQIPSKAAGLVAVALTGCLLTTDPGGFSGTDRRPAEAGADGPADAASDDGVPIEDDSEAGGGATCAPAAAFNDPVPSAGNVNTTANEGGPRLSPDELTLYFESDRAGGAGGNDIYVATRASRAAPFFGATPLASANKADRSEPEARRRCREEEAERPCFETAAAPNPPDARARIGSRHDQSTTA